MVKKGTCGLCQGGCAVVYTIEDGKIVKAEPDKESPKGRLCPRGALVPDILYGEERIKRPLIRVGERGEENSGSAVGKRLSIRLQNY